MGCMEIIAWMVVIFMAAVLYCLPSIIATMGEVEDKKAIIFYNLILGWTFVFWVICIVRAVESIGMPNTNSEEEALKSAIKLRKSDIINNNEYDRMREGIARGLISKLEKKIEKDKE